VSSDRSEGRPAEPRTGIKVAHDGPYITTGKITLTARRPVLDARGEPTDWSSGSSYPARATYVLCRCGQSRDKPFCDGTHRKVDFDGCCTADRAPGATRRQVYQGAGMTMTDDESLCAGYGFCDPHGGVWREVANAADPVVGQRLRRQIANCPSGRLQYRLEGSPIPIEQHFDPTIALIPDGPLWVLGGVPVETVDGFTYEVRNRQLLCRCGESRNKPFCDGSHRRANFSAP
jgi:CDGSH-type Zn-finger protein